MQHLTPAQQDTRRRLLSGARRQALRAEQAYNEHIGSCARCAMLHRTRSEYAECSEARELHRAYEAQSGFTARAEEAWAEEEAEREDDEREAWLQRRGR